MNKQLSVSILLLLIIGLASCDFFEDIKNGILIATGTTVGIVGGAKVLLTAVGFSSIGPVAGSVAATTQASIGIVVAGSAFAVAQSVAMKGVVRKLLLPASMVGIIVAVGYLLNQVC